MFGYLNFRLEQVENVASGAPAEPGDDRCIVACLVVNTINGRVQDLNFRLDVVDGRVRFLIFESHTHTHIGVTHGRVAPASSLTEVGGCARGPTRQPSRGFAVGLAGQSSHRLAVRPRAG